MAGMATKMREAKYTRDEQVGRQSEWKKHVRRAYSRAARQAAKSAARMARLTGES
jgi:hypothetical protein